MTCIVAHRSGWMVADRRITFSDSLIGPYQINKIIKRPGLLIASAGNAVVGDWIRDCVARWEGENALQEVIDMFRRESRSEPLGHALAVTKSGIYEVGGRGCLHTIAPEATHWAIGSGYQFALGWLASTEKYMVLRPRHAEAAIEFAATRVNDVGDGVQVELLDG